MMSLKEKKNADNTAREKITDTPDKLQGDEQKLLEIQQHYDRLIKNIPDGLYVWRFHKDDSMGFDYISPKFCELLGVKEKDVLKDYQVAFLAAHPDDLPDLIDKNARARIDMKPFRWEGRFIVHGKTRWIRISSDPMPVLPDGSSLWNGVVSDITERKQAELDLQSEKEFTNKALDTQPDTFFLFDVVAGKALRWNAAFREVSGYSDEEIASLPAPASYYSPEDLKVAGDAIERLLHGEPRMITMNLICKDGSKVPMEYRAASIKGENGEYRYIIAIGRDISERKQAEELLRQERDFADNLIETAQAIILVLDAHGRILHYNSYLENLSGFPLTDMRGKDWMESFIPKYERERIRKLFKTAASGQQTKDNVNAIRTRSGEERLIEWRDKVLKDVQGNPGLLAIGIDITERKQAEIALQKKSKELEEAQRISRVGNWSMDVATGHIYWSEQLYHMLGLEPSTTPPDYDQSGKLFTPESWERLSTSIAKAAEKGTPYQLELEMVRADGSHGWMLARGEARRDEKNTIVSVHGVAMDITEIKDAEKKKRLTERVFENTLEGVLITDANRKIIQVNKAFTRISGYTRDDAIGKDPGILQSGHHDDMFYQLMWKSINTRGHWVGEIWNRRKNGEVYPEALTISILKNDLGEVENYVGVFSDITLIKQHEKQLEHTAHYDELTGIPNRVLLADRMKQALAQARRNGSQLAVCYLDLDGFKQINDLMGHQVGDMILVEVASRIEEEIREEDTVARLGGDEFVILLSGLKQHDECEGSLNRVMQSIRKPMHVKNREFTLGVSIGVTMYPTDNVDADSLLRHADQAMYTAKQSGKDRYHFYDVRYDQIKKENQKICRQIAHGLSAGEFVMYYQPRVEIATGRLVGAESLIRWRHPERGLLTPDEFLPALEGNELDIELGEWVIHSALEQMRQWDNEGLVINVSINISAFHLQTSNFVPRLREQMKDYPELASERLQIEILETVALEDVKKITAIINECRTFGVTFALDDFGTGYSSLTYLKNLPVDTLKIDQQFVRDMLVDTGDRAIVQGVIVLARTFGHKVVAEGIETAETYELLKEMGCYQGQGYGICRPVPAEKLLKWHFFDPSIPS